MSLTARLAAATLGAGILFTGAGSALAAPADGSLEPQEGGTPTYVLDGVAVPLTDPTLGVPKVLEAGILPLGLLADATGQEGSTATENGAQNGPGSAEA